MCVCVRTRSATLIRGSAARPPGQKPRWDRLWWGAMACERGCMCTLTVMFHGVQAQQHLCIAHVQVEPLAPQPEPGVLLEEYQALLQAEKDCVQVRFAGTTSDVVSKLS